MYVRNLGNMLRRNMGKSNGRRANRIANDGEYGVSEKRVCSQRRGSVTTLCGSFYFVTICLCVVLVEKPRRIPLHLLYVCAFRNCAMRMFQRADAGKGKQGREFQQDSSRASSSVQRATCLQRETDNWHHHHGWAVCPRPIPSAENGNRYHHRDR